MSTKKKEATKAAKVLLGKRVSVERKDGVQHGIVKFYGKTQFHEGLWVGVALDSATGINDGTVKGVEYFKCKPNHGVFVQESAVQLLSIKTVAARRRSEAAFDADTEESPRMKKTVKKKVKKKTASTEADLDDGDAAATPSTKKKKTKKKVAAEDGGVDAAEGGTKPKKKVKKKKSAAKDEADTASPIAEGAEKPKTKKKTSKKKSVSTEEAPAIPAPRQLAPHEACQETLQTLTDKKLGKFAASKGIPLADHLDREGKEAAILHHLFPHLALGAIGSSSDDDDDQDYAESKQAQQAASPSPSGKHRQDPALAAELQDTRQRLEASQQELHTAMAKVLELEAALRTAQGQLVDAEAEVQEEKEKGGQRVRELERELDEARRGQQEAVAALNAATELEEAEEAEGKEGDEGEEGEGNSVLPVVRIKLVAPQEDGDGRTARYWRNAYETLQRTLQEQQTMQREAMAAMLRKARDMRAESKE